MRRLVLAVSITLGSVSQLAAQRSPFVRLTGGALNPGDPVATTIAYGAAAGVRDQRTSFLVLVLVQSQNRNSGADLTEHARTFVQVGFERSLRPKGVPLREPFVRASAGALLRAPFATAPVAGLGIGWRFALLPHLWLVASLSDEIAWLRREQFSCSSPWPLATPGTCVINGGPQNNFGGMVALEFRPRHGRSGAGPD
jgi:hypothetical protein